MRIGIVLPVAEREDGTAARWREIRELALTTEAAGLDSLWAADHLFYAPPDGEYQIGFWEAEAIVSALAEATTRVEIGHLVLCVPFRSPALLAYMANTLDEISGGRFVLGLGAGWHEPEFRAYGFEFERRVSVFEDSLGVLVPLLRDGHVDYQGRFAHGRGQLSPRGPRPHGPPILIASKQRRMHGLAARYAQRWNTGWYGLPAEPFWERRDGLYAACREIGRDPEEIEINVGLSIVESGEVGDRDRSRLLVAEREQIAEGLVAWQEQGVAEVMCRPEPATPEIVESVARAAEVLRGAVVVQ